MKMLVFARVPNTDIPFLLVYM